MSFIGNRVEALINWRNAEEMEGAHAIPVENPSPLGLRRLVAFSLGIGYGITGLVSAFLRALGSVLGCFLTLSATTRPFYQREFVDLRNAEFIAAPLTIAYSVTQIATARMNRE